MQLKYLIYFMPLLFLADYYLTIFGNILSQKKYKMHFIFENYELNPFWKKDVNKIKWFNIKHLLIVIIITFLVYLVYNLESKKTIFLFCCGAIYITYGSIIGGHISNILIFKYLINNPDEIKGKIIFSYKFLYRLSQFQHIIFLIPLTIIAIVVNNVFVYGGIVGMIATILAHNIWLAKSNKLKKDKIIDVNNENEEILEIKNDTENKDIKGKQIEYSNSGLAIASFSLSFTAFIPILGVLHGLISIILGIIALIKTKNMNKLHKVLSVLGIILSFFGILITIIIFSYLYFLNKNIMQK
ncbi:MAG: hypothetical protein ACP5Q5_10750 [Brevinematia bacterium]